jgi:hypothetical protein
LFKLELCPEIRSVFVNHLIPRPIVYAPLPVRVEEPFKNESARETDKGEGFADDTTGLTLFELESLSTLKQCLIDFGAFSGLQCNVDKTVLMQVGNIIPPSDEIVDLGFTFVESIKILGMEIDNKIENLDVNFATVLEKKVLYTGNGTTWLCREESL